MHALLRLPSHACESKQAWRCTPAPPQVSYAYNNLLLSGFQGVTDVDVCFWGKHEMSDGLEKDGQRPRLNLHKEIKEKVFKVGHSAQGRGDAGMAAVLACLKAAAGKKLSRQLTPASAAQLSRQPLWLAAP